MTHRPDPARALSQLDRHRSGNPNNPPPVPLTWEQAVANLPNVLGMSFTTLAGQFASLQESMRLDTPDPDQREIVIDSRILGGVTTAQALRDAEAGMRRLAVIALGWRMGA